MGPDSISSGKVVLGVVLVLLALRSWRKRPAPGEQAEMPRWMASVETISPARAFVLGVLLAGANPKNLALSLAAGAGLAQLGLSTSDAVASLVVFVVVGSLTIGGAVLGNAVGGTRAQGALDDLKAWLTAHHAAVMAVLLLVFGVDLIAKGMPPLTS